MISTETIDLIHKLNERIVDELDTIQGKWNGDESGKKEDRANIASDAQEHYKEFLQAISELEE